MLINVYMRTFDVQWTKIKECHSLEEVEQLLDNETHYTDYMTIGYDENGEPIVSSGKIDRPLVKRLKH